MAAQRSVQMGTDPATLSPAQQYIAALGSYQYPPDQGRAGGPPDGPQRRLDWQAAFCALYDSFRAGVCPAFYVVPPEGRQPAGRSGVVLFGSAGLGGRGAEHAILTRSSSGQRSFFANQCGLEPLTPLAARGEAAAKRGDKTTDDGSARSMVCFEGRDQVHGLFDFLLNELTKSDDVDVPLLLSPTPFLHGALSLAQPKVLPPIMEHAEGSHPRHQLELRGLTPPWVVDRVTVLLAASGPLSVHTEAHPLTHTLNWTHADRPQAPPAPTGDDVAARQGGCWDAIEQARWRGGAVSVKDGGWHRPRVGCRFARSVAVEGQGRFVTTLASRGLDGG